MTFEIRVKRTFNATHALSYFHGKMEKPHLHEWTCELICQTPSLDDAGCAIDFIHIDSILDKVLTPLINQNIHELSAFEHKSASTENIALFIYHQCKSIIPESIGFSLWEDPNHKVTIWE